MEHCKRSASLCARAARVLGLSSPSSSSSSSSSSSGGGNSSPAADSALCRVSAQYGVLDRLQTCGMEYDDAPLHSTGRSKPPQKKPIQFPRVFVHDGGLNEQRSQRTKRRSPTNAFYLCLSASGLVFGTLYPAYSSYKAVKSKDVKEYVKWMMYWIIFALFTSVEVFTDMFLCWLPFYYELKIAFVVWLLSPYTKGSSVLYRKFVHPTLSSKEKDIDDYICQAKDKSYDTLVHYGRKGLNVAATAAVMAATKGQGVLTDRLRSFSMQDLAAYESDTASSTQPTSAEAAAQHRARTMMRSKSESYNKASS
ncbi:receptor expression-enhancing protein 1 isoform X2 [Phyllopteryx taeniolatus]|uniref:receptor expression-enhancing protein 1 isoform X2 n=1 Tax=Phyllopteryx taeniolatus TaxID=161469 RepID=UPI002AD5120B|nr:receptor expression-enhancing protein 1 isoform X2 [Phyllopteryx taeniolatus]